MWELRDHRYGGRKKRYEQFPKGVLRCLDPLTKRPVSFANELQFENWLLHWGNTKVRELIVSPGRYSCLEQGKSISIRPHLLVKWTDASKSDEIQIVTSLCLQAETVKVAKIQKVALANDLNWSIRTRLEIRRNTVLLDNLLHFRQCLAITADDDLAPAIDVALKVIESKIELHRADLFDALHDVCNTETQMDALLFHLIRAGKISLPIEYKKIGNCTCILRVRPCDELKSN